jgi:hypothetical protein
MRRYLVSRACLLLLLAGLAFCIIVSFRWTPGINGSNHARLFEGMHKTRVYEILGLPGDYRTTPNPFPKLGRLSHDMPSQAWLGDEGAIFVWFDGDEVCDTSFIPSLRVQKSLVTEVKESISSFVFGDF